MMSLFSTLAPEYCERVGNSILSEPLNLLSNLVFFVVAFFVYKLYKRKKITGFGYWFLFYLLLLIGAGSSLWHSFRNPYTLLLDSVPIFIFVFSLTYLLLRKLLASSQKAALLISAFILLQIGVSYLFPSVLNGSVRHIVNIGVFVLLGYFIYTRNIALRKDIIVVVAVYALAIFFRSIDNHICPSFSLGTHFLWHAFTATASYLGIKILTNMR